MPKDAEIDSVETLTAEAMEEDDYSEEDLDQEWEEDRENRLNDQDLKNIEDQYYSIYQKDNDNDYTINGNLYEMKDLFSKALKTLKGVSGINSYDFCFYQNFKYFPIAVVLKDDQLTEDPDNAHITRKIRYVLPFEDRFLKDKDFRTNNPTTNSNNEAYVFIINLLLQNRQDINFYELYKNHRPLIFSIIDKEYYNKNFKTIVDVLLIAYDDLSIDFEQKYKQIDSIMLSHYKVNHIRNSDGRYSTDLDFYNRQLETIMSENARERISKIYQEQRSKENTSVNQASIIWSYSFWNRRRLERNIGNTYQLLRAIDIDYTDFEH